MTKKMKGVVFDSSSYGGYEDVKARFKHQTLMQEYQELQKEVNAKRNKLDNGKQRKLTLLAEVRFLRRRYKYLKNKSGLPREQELVQPRNVEIQRKNNTKVRIHDKKKELTRRNLPLISKVNQKGQVYVGKEDAPQTSMPKFDWDQKETKCNGMETALFSPTPFPESIQRGLMYRGGKAVVQSPMTAIDLNSKERVYGGNHVALRNPSPDFDLNRNESTLSGRGAALQSRAPVFDLNQISTEEEELQNKCEPLRFEELKKGLANKGGNDEPPLNDLMLSVCRNVGDGSNRSGKRKISWQDPVALRV
ncbi:hypothetical protein RJ640_007334 [Escallonia rubra]|uniref:Uncharacterized protein n=1 Tax=Escallonia rubra TaxID=112253 RepID=A0AA88RX10_9ASTE|nr:hypothetical protein RJ640_007334 [Escallonia rubra]